MQRELKVYLWDLQKALGEIEQFTAGKTLEDYRSERILQLAMEREFIIIGEVLSKIVQFFPETKTRIDQARKIANFRNILVHEYHRIRDEEVWQILTVSAPSLRREVAAWLEELVRADPSD